MDATTALERLSHQLMAAESKAKRRVTLSMVGLGFIETDDAAVRSHVHVDLQTGELVGRDPDQAEPAPPVQDAEEHRLLEVARHLYRTVIKPTGSRPLADVLVACCFGVTDWAQLPMLAHQDLEAGLPLLGHLCDCIAKDSPPGPGEEVAWCAAEKRRWEARRTRPDQGPLVEDPGEEDELVFPFEADVVDDDPGDPGEVP